MLRHRTLFTVVLRLFSMFFYSLFLFFYVGVENAFLLQIMGHAVLSQKWSLDADFGADPLAFVMWLIGRMVTSSAAAELRPKVCALDLVELANLMPRLVADRSCNINL